MLTTFSGLRAELREPTFDRLSNNAPDFARRFLQGLDPRQGSVQLRVAYSSDNRPLAGISYETLREGQEHLQIRTFFVAQEERGRGLGTLLLQRLVSDARSQGAKSCYAILEAGSSLGSFFARFGFLGKLEQDGRYRYDATSSSLLPSPRPASLLTKRLLLRPLELEDLLDVFRYASNPNVSRYTLWDTHRSHADTLDFIRQYAFSSYGHGNSDPYAVVSRESGRVMGTVGCFWKSRRNRSMELGYAFAEDCWGKGYCPESCRAVIRHAFESYQIERLICRCIRENHQSERVMRKLGFQLEGIKRRALFSKGRYWDLIEMSMLREDYFEIIENYKDLE